MKTYQILIKQIKAQIEDKQKGIEQVNRDKLNLEHQIDHLVDTIEKEQMEVSLHKRFFNPMYFDRLTNKIKAYSHLLTSKTEELQQLQDEVFELFSMRKKYELLLENHLRAQNQERQRKQMEQLQDIFIRPRSPEI